VTYCLGIITKYGLVLGADSRTNAGVDYISTYQKLFDFSQTGERAILVCTSGNLSVTQAIMNLLQKDLKIPEEANIHTLPTLYDIARYIGSKIRLIQEQDRSWLQQDGIEAQCTLLLGGQIKGQEPELFMVYSQGNCIQSSKDTPFLQIGETKYGKPILDRILKFDTPLKAAAKCALLSIDSTMKSNISVGPPINLMMYQKDTFKIEHQLRLGLGDPYLIKIRQHWEMALRDAFDRMADVDWQHHLHKGDDDWLNDS
jgi:putative proteasome-type protease